jgi:acyl-CoA reductase-like NAD-dependent aldehyde dehydrogenase
MWAALARSAAEVLRAARCRLTCVNPGSGVTHRTRWSSEREADRFAVENPATGETIAVVQGCGEAEVNEAVKAAHKAYQSHWRWLAPRERGRLLLECAPLLRGHADELAALETLENGKPYTQSRPYDIELLISSFEYFGAAIDKSPGEFQDSGIIHSLVLLEPYGVVAGIIPFNWPPIHTGAKSAPALAVGNTVVLKPGEQAPLTVMRIVELLQSVLPPDVLHVVPGHGAIAGRALAAHPLVSKLSFTGSTPTGSAVLKLAAEHVTPALVELGGKNAFIVFENADLDAALAGAIDAAFFNQGEACTAGSRILVQRSIHDEFVERFGRAVARLRVGDGADAKTHVGPLVTRAHQKRVLDYIQLAHTEGATLAAQASLPSARRLTDGFFVPPSLFTDVKPSMRVAREEVFGPVTFVMPFDTFDEAIAIANDTAFGLVAGIYSSDAQMLMRAARRLDVGVVFVNNYYRAILGTPFGGAKASGYGREHAMQTLREYGRSKAIRMPSGEGPIPEWFAAGEVLSASEAGREFGRDERGS